MRFLVPFFIIVSGLSSCDAPKYSGEDEKKLVEAQKMHNESLAIFSKTLPLLAQLTEIRSSISKSLGMTEGDTATTGGTVTDSAEVDTTGNGQKAIPRDSANISKSDKGNVGQKDSENAVDTTGSGNKMNALEKLNQAQIDLLTWMRNIYLVPDVEGIYDEEKAANSAIGADQNSAMLRTDMEFKKLSESATTDEIYAKQKEMHDEIVRINNAIKKAIEEGKSANF